MSQLLHLDPQLVIHTSRERFLLQRYHAIRDESPHRLTERLWRDDRCQTDTSSNSAARASVRRDATGTPSKRSPSKRRRVIVKQIDAGSSGRTGRAAHP